MAAFEVLNEHQMGLCNCMSHPQTIKSGFKSTVDEAKEMMEEIPGAVKKSVLRPGSLENVAGTTWDKVKDEASDVMWGLGRTAAAVINKVRGNQDAAMVRMPGDQIHYDKVKSRYEAQGCGRSARQVASGKGCVPPPSA